jgi:hypothetical protein
VEFAANDCLRNLFAQGVGMIEQRKINLALLPYRRL